MSEPASPKQLRTAYLRWALITVPTILLLGLLSGKMANSGYGNRWFDALQKPMIMPPAWAFPVAWSTLYILMGLALAFILNARGAKSRGIAILFFLVQLALNLAWSPVFFAMHRIMLAFGLIIAIFLWAGLATILFWHIRRAAGLLMLPYLAWLLFAGLLNWEIHRLNPSGAAVIITSSGAEIIVQ